MKNQLFLILLLLLSASLVVQAQSEKKVLFIGIDGCRPDALQLANTPNIDLLISNASYSMDAMNGGITWSGPGWSNLLTGVRDNKHGVTDNFFFGQNYAQYPHFFNRIEEYNSAFVTASFTTWLPLNSTILDQYDIRYYIEYLFNGDQLVSDSLTGYLVSGDPDVIFMYYGDVDAAGHADGFSPTVPEYISAIETTDAYIGNLLSSINSRPNIANEDWLIIVSTDHGGTGLGHGGTSFVEENIFMIVSGDNVPNLEYTKDSVFNTDSGKYVYDYSNTFRQVDLVPTILEFLCIPINPTWGLEGKSMIDSCIVVDAHQIKGGEELNSLVIIPNPASDICRIQYRDNDHAVIRLTDLYGRNTEPDIIKIDDGWELNISTLSSGIYFIEVMSARTLVTKKIIISR